MRINQSVLALAPIITLALAAPTYAQEREAAPQDCPEKSEECPQVEAEKEDGGKGAKRTKTERREDRRDARAQRREDRQDARAERREDRQDAKAERREDRQDAKAERREDRRDAKVERREDKQDARAERQQRDTSRDRAAQRGDKPSEADQAASTQGAAGDTVEKQLEAQGDVEDARNVRSLREQLTRKLESATEDRPAEQGRQEPAQATSRDGRDGDRDRQRADRDNARDRDGRRAGRDGDGRRRIFDRAARDGKVVERRGARIVLDLGGGRIAVQSELPDEAGRLLFGARDVDVDPLRGGGARTTVHRRNGSKIITERDRYGNIVLRKRVTRSGREIVLIDNRTARDHDFRRSPRRPRVRLPESRYIVDLGRASRRDIRIALLADPVEKLDRRYTLSEVLYYEPVRAYAPRIDLDTITFDFGSATISDAQMGALTELGAVLEEVLRDNPDELYLIEGHTDAVGSDYDNIILSDERAEAVAVALSQNFDIPPENLVTKGYGEQYQKVKTEAPERRNRRATVRRVTELVARN